MKSCESLLYFYKLWLVDETIVDHTLISQSQCSDGCANLRKEVKEFFIVKLHWHSCISELDVLRCCTMLIQFNKQRVNLSEWLRATSWPSPKWCTWCEPVVRQVHKIAGCPIYHFNIKRVFIPHSELYSTIHAELNQKKYARAAFGTRPKC